MLLVDVDAGCDAFVYGSVTRGLKRRIGVGLLGFGCDIMKFEFVFDWVLFRDATRVLLSLGFLPLLAGYIPREGGSSLGGETNLLVFGRVIDVLCVWFDGVFGGEVDSTWILSECAGG